jgi:hypothetical protein
MIAFENVFYAVVYMLFQILLQATDKCVKYKTISYFQMDYNGLHLAKCAHYTDAKCCAGGNLNSR